MAAAKGNRYAAKAKRWEEALLKALARSAGSIEAGLAPIADNVVKFALAGDKDAIRELADRIDGRASQSLEVSGDVTHRHATELTDEQLLARLTELRTIGADGVMDAEAGSQEPTELH